MSTAIRHQRHYRVCGLRVCSTIPFPELPAVAGADDSFQPDVEFDMAEDFTPRGSGQVVMETEEADGTTWLTCTRSRQGYHLRFSEYADFLIDRSGRRVTCAAPPETPPETIRHLFLDQVIPPLLNLRGREALHASAVGIAGGACAFIGMSGQGKSTLASAFHVIGHPILSDDCLVLKDDANSVQVEPAYPGLRLWDDSRGALFGSRRSTLPVSHYNDKRRVATRAFRSELGESIALRRIYSLLREQTGRSATRPTIEPLSVRDAFMELVSYAFRLDLTDQTMILRQMRVLERVAKAVPIMRLRLPDDLEALPAARELITQDFERG